MKHKLKLILAKLLNWLSEEKEVETSNKLVELKPWAVYDYGNFAAVGHICDSEDCFNHIIIKGSDGNLYTLTGKFHALETCSDLPNGFVIHGLKKITRS